MRADILHPCRLSLFFLLSLADLFLTWRLFGQYGDQVCEMNPIADWVLEEFDWFGLVAFKLAMMLAVGGLQTVISLYRPAAGGRVLSFACSTVAAVVIYSSALCWSLDVDITANVSQRSLLISGPSSFQ